MAGRDVDSMSRKELIEELQRLQQALANDDVLRATIHDLEVHRDELRASQAELAESRTCLEQSRDAYAALFDFAPIGYVILDGAGVVTNLNLTAGSLMGTERSRLIGYPFFSLVSAEHRRRCLDYLRRCRQLTRGEPRSGARGGTLEIELELRRRGGDPVPVLATTKVMNPGGASLTEYHVALTDLTERKRLEAESRRLDEERRTAEHEHERARAESASKDHFIAILSHELRTPLAPIRFAVASLRRAGHLPEALRHALDIIDRNVAHEARIIDDLLDATRIAQQRLHLTIDTVDVHELVEEIAATHAPEIEQAGLHLALQLGAARHHVPGDQGRLRQVLVNLVRNAWSNTPPQGHVTIHTANPSPDRLAVTVRDDGRGMERAQLAKLFRPFEHLGDPGQPTAGLGLGLSICKGIIEGHQGRITAASEGPGRGATFTVELPATTPEMAREPARAPEPLPPTDASPKRESVSILLVEDNLDSAEATAALLEMFGYRVRVAGSVEAALGAAERDFDVLVSDIGLPDGTGRDLIRELSARRPVRGIALTGYGTSEDVLQNTHAGFARHLVKPVDPEKLVATIDELMHARLGDGTDGPAPLKNRR